MSKLMFTILSVARGKALREQGCAVIFFNGPSVTHCPTGRAGLWSRRVSSCSGWGCACRKSNPGILVMQPAQDWAAKNVPDAIDGARDRRILLQG
jgi:hypothetical protein